MPSSSHRPGGPLVDIYMILGAALTPRIEDVILARAPSAAHGVRNGSSSRSRMPDMTMQGMKSQRIIARSQAKCLGLGAHSRSRRALLL